MKNCVGSATNLNQTFPRDKDGRFEIIVFLLDEIKEIENTGLKISKI